MAVTTIMTHGGKAHADDFLSVCLALYEHPAAVVKRRQPTDAEIMDPSVLVLDTGKDFNPQLNNFDHHQVRGMPCAFHLYCEHLGLDQDMARYHDWYRALSVLDTVGGLAYARESGFPRYPHEVHPVQTFVLNLFSQVPFMDPFHAMHSVMRDIGWRMVSYIDDMRRSMKILEEQAKVVVVNGVDGIVLDHVDNLARDKYRSENAPQAAFFIGRSYRPKEGYFLHRYSDDPRVDFSTLSKSIKVVFAHHSGFYATTTSDVASLDEVMQLLDVYDCIGSSPQ